MFFFLFKFVSDLLFLLFSFLFFCFLFSFLFSFVFSFVLFLIHFSCRAVLSFSFFLFFFFFLNFIFSFGRACGAIASCAAGQGLGRQDAIAPHSLRSAHGASTLQGR